MHEGQIALSVHSHSPPSTLVFYGRDGVGQEVEEKSYPSSFALARGRTALAQASTRDTALGFSIHSNYALALVPRLSLIGNRERKPTFFTKILRLYGLNL